MTLMMGGIQDFQSCIINFWSEEVFSDNEGIKDAMCIITSGALCRTSIFDEVGYFLNEYFIDYVDNEFCLRLLISGYRVCVCIRKLLFNMLLVTGRKIWFFANELSIL